MAVSLIPSPLPSGSVSSLVDFEHLGGPGGTIPPPLTYVERPGAGGYAEISGTAASHRERGTPTDIDEDRGDFIFDKSPSYWRQSEPLAEELMRDTAFTTMMKLMMRKTPVTRLPSAPTIYAF